MPPRHWSPIAQSLGWWHNIGALHMLFTQMFGFLHWLSFAQPAGVMHVLPWHREASQFVTTLHICPVGQSESFMH
jgi:hypothetical protein